MIKVRRMLKYRQRHLKKTQSKKSKTLSNKRARLNFPKPLRNQIRRIIIKLKDTHNSADLITNVNRISIAIKSKANWTRI